MGDCENCGAIQTGRCDCVEEEYVLLGWIARDMETYVKEGYFLGRMIRKLPKIYRTEKVAARYGTPKAVYIKNGR